MGTVTEMTPRAELVTRKAQTWPEVARAAAEQIADPESYTSASELLLGIKELRREANEVFDPIIATALQAHRTAVAQKRTVTDPLDEADRLIKRGMVAYDEAQARREEERRRRLEAEARREEEDRRLAQAVALEQAGREFGDDGLVAEADALIAEPIETPPVRVEPARPKVAGISYTTRWSASVTDLMALVRYVAANPQFSNLLTPNMPALNGMARSLRGSLALPGVRAVSSRDVSAGGGRR